MMCKNYKNHYNFCSIYKNYIPNNLNKSLMYSLYIINVLVLRLMYGTAHFEKIINMTGAIDNGITMIFQQR
jgi:hypothetical protein